MKSLCVYCGSSAGRRPVYVRNAEALGAEIARRGITLVYGGASIGLMGRLADSVLCAGGFVEGVIPQSLVDRELAHQGLTKLHVVGSMHHRKQLMAELSDGFVAMPGGLGTLEELFETLTWAQLGIHEKPCGLLNVSGYFDGLLEWLEHATEEKFLHPLDSERLLVSDQPVRLIDALAAYRPKAPVKIRDLLDSEQR